MIKTGQMRRYLFYAMGEIILVMLGIYLALQVNNWNADRKLRDKELNLLEELVLNLETNIENLFTDVSRQEDQADKMNYLIDHLEAKKPYNDTVSHFLDISMPAPDVILTSSAFETLKSSGLDIIQSNTLRKEIVDLFEIHYPYLMQETKRLEDQMWPSVVLPIQHKHFVMMPQERYIPNDYEALLDDQEFLNMLSFRLTMRVFSTEIKGEAIQRTEHVICALEREIR